MWPTVCLSSSPLSARSPVQSCFTYGSNLSRKKKDQGFGLWVRRWEGDWRQGYHPPREFDLKQRVNVFDMQGRLKHTKTAAVDHVNKHHYSYRRTWVSVSLSGRPTEVFGPGTYLQWSYPPHLTSLSLPWNILLFYLPVILFSCTKSPPALLSWSSLSLLRHNVIVTGVLFCSGAFSPLSGYYWCIQIKITRLECTTEILYIGYIVRSCGAVNTKHLKLHCSLLFGSGHRSMCEPHWVRTSVCTRF